MPSFKKTITSGKHKVGDIVELHNGKVVKVTGVKLYDRESPRIYEYEYTYKSNPKMRAGTNPSIKRGRWFPAHAVRFNHDGSISIMK